MIIKIKVKMIKFYQSLYTETSILFDLQNVLVVKSAQKIRFKIEKYSRKFNLWVVKTSKILTYY